ncbi:hypothetical protein P3S68_001933 [Capsicum galapagoense]
MFSGQKGAIHQFYYRRNHIRPDTSFYAFIEFVNKEDVRKIIFAAPLCPLVLQQVEALHEFVDIPQGTAVNIIVGSYVWFEDPDVASVDGEVEKISNGKADIERTDGKKVVR